MWTFLLDPVFQGVAFVLALSGLAFVAWDLYDSARDPSPATSFAKARREPPRAAQEPRRRAYVEPSLEIWTDSQGETRGRVRRGPSRGMRLEEMSREDCDAQAAYAREHDPPAAAALDGFIRQRFGPKRRAAPSRPEGEMTRADALQELGLADGASHSEIHAAYRAEIKKHHPDHGGSHAKAARINRAKDLLEG